MKNRDVMKRPYQKFLFFMCDRPGHLSGCFRADENDIPAMVCIIGVGLLLSVRTGFLQIRKFPYAIRTTVGRMFRKREPPPAPR